MCVKKMCSRGGRLFKNYFQELRDVVIKGKFE